MKHGTRVGSTLGENIAAFQAHRATGIQASKRKVLCWVCQKEKSIYDGVTSGIVKKSGKLYTAGNCPTKFICFSCKPPVETANTENSA